MLLFIFVAGGVAPFASTFISALAFGSAHGIPWHTVWRNWYRSHALGMIIAASFLISVTSSEWRAIRIRQRLGEAIAILAFIIADAVELLVKPASPKSLHEHIARLALRHSQANPSAAFGQNQRRPAEPQDKKPGELALA